MTETLTQAVRRMTLEGSQPTPIALALGADANQVRTLIARLRMRRDLPPPPAANPNSLSGQVLQLLDDQQPNPLSMLAIRRCLGCGQAALLRALDKLTGIGAIHVQDTLVTLLDRVINDDPRPAPVPLLPSPERARVLHAAIRRRAFACVAMGDREGAVSLLNRAAERSPPAVATNFLVLGDLLSAPETRGKGGSIRGYGGALSEAGFCD